MHHRDALLGVDRRCAALAFVLAQVFGMAVLVTSPARAQDDEHRLRWSPHWARVHPASYAVMGAAVAGALVFDFVIAPGPEALLRGPEIVDEPIRDRLMARSEEDRERAALLSDVLLGTLLAWPYFDSIVVAGIGDQNADVFWQLSMINAESYAADLLIGTIAKRLLARERPHGVRCTLEDRLEDPLRCGPDGRLRGLYSGHASASFNAAGLVCVHHVHLRLYGSEAADYAACGAALLSASFVATLRVIADRHYATDVILGALVGMATGFLLPYLLHYRWDPDAHVRPDVGATARPLSVPVFSLAGSF